MNITTVFHSGPRKERTVSKDGSPHVTDEICNALISGLGTFLAAVGSIYLIYKSYEAHQLWNVLAFAIYGVCAINLFLSSALHHAVEGPDHVEARLLKWDYMAIYAMIAGAMTPFCLTLLRHSVGLLMMGLIWGLALIGIILKASWKKFPKWLEMIFYIGMGWLGVFIIYPVCQIIGYQLLYWVALMGAVYTMGAMIYYYQKPNFIPGRFGFHEIWHLFVLFGSLINFFVLYRYVATI